MAEDLDRSRSDIAGKAPWLKIFMGFKLALDPKKLLLAAMGIFVAYLGWWAISYVFYSLGSEVPTAAAYQDLKTPEAKDAYLKKAYSWTLLHRLGGTPVPADVVTSWDKVENAAPDERISNLLKEMGHGFGVMRECPWAEERGPNQFLVLSKILGRSDHELSPSEAGSYLLFSVEPLYKFLVPVVFFFDSRAGGMLSWNRLYLIMIMFWTIATWGIFGGAITRIACVQLARSEKVGLRESLDFVCSRWQGFVFAPVLPLLALLVLSIMLWVFGLFFGITFVLGDIVGGILWPITMVLGLIMAVIMVGLLGWPLMNATISTEGTDSFDALSRSYSYVYQVPWHCLWYAAVSLVYGAVLVFFVGFMGSLLVYLGNWGVTQANFFDSRDPAYLCVYAPTSFGWRDVLLKDSKHAKFDSEKGHYEIPKDKIPSEWYLHTSLGTYLVSFWLGLFFLMIIGFGYSFFWTAATIIYLLLRQKVDDTDLDEVFMEEDEDKPFMPESPAPSAPAAHAPTPAAPTPASTPPGVKFTMVDLSTSNLGSPPPAPSPSPAPAPTPAPTSDGPPQTAPASPEAGSAPPP